MGAILFRSAWIYVLAHCCIVLLSCSNIPKTAQAYLAPVADKMANLQLDGENGNANTGDTATTPTSRSRPKWGGGDYCPRCDKQVFIAEKMAAAGHVSDEFMYLTHCGLVMPYDDIDLGQHWVS